MTSTLSRVIGLAGVVSLVVGSAIGSGIFKKPSAMLAHVGDPWLLIGVWVLAGLLTLAGALSNAEVGAMLPEEGGQYAYFKQMYGRFFAFIFGWACLTVIQTGSFVSISYVFAESINRLIEIPTLAKSTVTQLEFQVFGLGHFSLLENFGVKTLTALIVGGLTWLHITGVRRGTKFQIIITSAKVFVFLSIIVLGLSSSGDWSHMTTPLPASTDNLLIAVMAAMAGAFWAYDGWNNSSYVAAEVHNPARNIPVGLIVGMGLVIGIYVLINFAYLHVLSPQEIVASKIVGIDMMAKLFGPIGTLAISFAILLSTFGAASGSLMASARIPFAMARDGLLPQSLGQINNRYLTPANALRTQFVWGLILIYSGSFDILTDMLIFVAFIFYGAAALGVIVMRVRAPNLPRPFKVPGYPWTPLLFVIFTLIFLVATLISDVEAFNAGRSPVINSLLGLGLLLTGVPVYLLFSNKKRQHL